MKKKKQDAKQVKADDAKMDVYQNGRDTKCMIVFRAMRRSW